MTYVMGVPASKEGGEALSLNWMGIGSKIRAKVENSIFQTLVI